MKRKTVIKRRMRVQLRLFVLNTLDVPAFFRGSVATLRKAVLDDSEIESGIRKLIRLKRLGILRDRDIVEFLAIRDIRLALIAWRLAGMPSIVEMANESLATKMALGRG